MRSALLLASLFVACTADPSAPTTTQGGASSTSSGGSEGTAESVGPTSGPSGTEGPGTTPTTGESGSSSTGEASAANTGDTSTGDASTDAVSTGEASTGDASTGDASTGDAAGGCGQDPGAQDLKPKTIMVDGVARQYIVSLPAGYDPNKAYPLVFAWHGRGGDGALARLYFKVEEASQGQAIFVYPYGLPLPEMQNQTGWDLNPSNEDFAFFDALMLEMAARLCVDEARVFSTGHSFGGYMSNQIGCFRGDVVRAIGVVASGGPYGGGCTGPVASWIAHGTGDVVVPYSEGTNSLKHWSAANSCSGPGLAVDPAPCVAEADCDADAPVVWCSHKEADFMGHGWPNWAGAGIWSFFAGL